MSHASPTPLPRTLAEKSFWVAPGLLAGAYPGAEDPAEHEAKLRALLALGVTRVITLMEPDERNHAGRPFRSYAAALEAAGVVVERYAIPDGSTPSVETVVTVLDVVDRALDAGDVVYLHCWGGRGRTGVIVGCWLVRHARAQPDAAVEALRALRVACAGPNAVPDTPGQERRITSWTSGQ